jgi:hypothetical protein
MKGGEIIGQSESLNRRYLGLASLRGDKAQGLSA